MADKKPIIYPTNSPITALGYGDEERGKVPPKINGAKKRIVSILRKLAPLLEASKTADQVYANGYFERHYPEADKKMKSLLHDKVMAAWSNSDNDDEEHEERSLGTGLNITINVGG